MPIHIRAAPGDYAEACLLPGDPPRAKYVAETYLDDVQERNHERGLLGHPGAWGGQPVPVQGTGMGCPAAASRVAACSRSATSSSKASSSGFPTTSCARPSTG